MAELRSWEMMKPVNSCSRVLFPTADPTRHPRSCLVLLPLHLHRLHPNLIVRLCFLTRETNTCTHMCLHFLAIFFVSPSSLRGVSQTNALTLLSNQLPPNWFLDQWCSSQRESAHHFCKLNFSFYSFSDRVPREWLPRVIFVTLVSRITGYYYFICIYNMFQITRSLHGIYHMMHAIAHVQRPLGI